MNDRCEARCLHGGKCWLVAGHVGWHETKNCAEWGASEFPPDGTMRP